MQPRDNPTGADNQQGSLSEIDLAWTAGHFDGDGWIGMMRQKRPKAEWASKWTRYVAASMVVTTSPDIAEKVSSVIRGLGVKCQVVYRPPQEKPSGKVWRAQYHVTTKSNIATKVFLSTIEPYLVEKKHQAQIVLDYIAWRETQPRTFGRHNLEGLNELQRRGQEAHRLLHEHRTRHDPSTTTRSAPESPGEDIV